MIESREHLLVRKAEMLDALRALERDHEDGSVDDQSYRRARSRFEGEAALILQEIDRSTESGTAVPPKLQSPRRLISLIAGLAIVGALTLFLISALNNRSAGQTITGTQPGSISNPTSSGPPAVLAAEKKARANPRSYADALSMGNAYLDAGDRRDADRAYLRAESLSPARPEAPTLHALLLASSGKDSPALSVLRRVEGTRPLYARAWFIDGLISSRRTSGYNEAVSSWAYFLRLTPTGPVAVEVKSFLQKLCVVHAPDVTQAMRLRCSRALKP
jgi:cytochrome c-type biogenesis protein CcmH/NrfG